MFDREDFVARCRAAVASGGGQREIREILAEAVRDPASVAGVLGEPRRAGIEMLYRGADLTILNLTWGPRMTAMPHNHHLWAAIGMYGGREDNLFWRTLPADARWPLEAAGARALMTGDVCTLGPEIVHSVTNPLSRFSSAIHVYGGDFPAQPREQWDEETLQMRPFDHASALRLFDEANRLLDRAAAA